MANHHYGTSIMNFAANDHTTIIKDQVIFMHSPDIIIGNETSKVVIEGIVWKEMVDTVEELKRQNNIQIYQIRELGLLVDRLVLKDAVNEINQ